MLARSLLRSRAGRVLGSRSAAALPDLLVRLKSTEVEKADPNDPGPGFIDKYQLTDASRWVPLSIAGFGAATATGLYTWNEESQLLGLFALFCGTIYANGAPIGKMFDEGANAILKEQQELEDKQIDAAKAVRGAHAQNEGIDADMAAIMEAQQALMAQVAVAKSSQLKHLLREQIVGNLSAVVELEEMNTARLQSEMVNAATEKVLGAWTAEGSADLKDSAMSAALAALADPEAKPASDTVGVMYVKAFGDIRSKIEANSGSDVALSPAQQTETMDAVKSLLGKRGLMPTAADLSSQGLSDAQAAEIVAQQAAALAPVSSIKM